MEKLDNEDIYSEGEDHLCEYFSIQVDKGQSPIRIDVFLQDKLNQVSRNKIQQAAKAESILVNGKAIKPNYKVRPLDQIQIVLPQTQVDYTVHPENLDLEIVYEDADVLIINKRAGMVVHPGHGNFNGTLVNGLMYLYEQWPHINGSTRPGIVHRLDKNTTGLIIAGKTEFALTHLAKQFYDRTIQRHYIGLVWGDIEDNTGRIEINISRSPYDRKRFMAVADGSIGKFAATNYEVIKRYGYVTLVKCKLETGRTHQIRVHMKHIGHTLFNDFTYGGDKIMCGTVYTKYKQFIDNCYELMPHHALHAQSLGFTHPTTGEKMYFETPLPKNFQLMLDKWETYTKAFKL